MATELDSRELHPHGGTSANLNHSDAAKMLAIGRAAAPSAGPASDEAIPSGAGRAHPSSESSTPRAPLFADSDNSDTGESEDRPSSELTSPSITSPPYWTNTSHGHARTWSNVSAESVLPVGAITLQDNETDDDPHNRNFYGRDRNRGCWAKSVQVTDYVTVNGSATNIGAFVVWNIRVETLSGSFMNIRKRYSEFDDFRHRLVQTFPNFEAAVPVLPPKSIISKFRPHFLEKRKVGLEYFLNCILLNPEFSGSPVLKEFLFS